MEKIFTNNAMLMHIENLKKFLHRDDIIGYAAARNLRRLLDASFDFCKKRDQLISEYGSEVLDNDGKPTGQYRIDSNDPNFQKCNDILVPLAMIEHSVDIFQVSPNDVIGKLSGQEILEIDWMIKYE